MGTSVALLAQQLFFQDWVIMIIYRSTSNAIGIKFDMI